MTTRVGEGATERKNDGAMGRKSEKTKLRRGELERYTNLRKSEEYA